MSFLWKPRGGGRENAAADPMFWRGLLGGRGRGTLEEVLRLAVGRVLPVPDPGLTMQVSKHLPFVRCHVVSAGDMKLSKLTSWVAYVSAIFGLSLKCQVLSLLICRACAPELQHKNDVSNLVWQENRFFCVRYV